MSRKHVTCGDISAKRPIYEKTFTALLWIDDILQNAVKFLKLNSSKMAAMG